MKDQSSSNRSEQISAQIAALASLSMNELKIRWRDLYDTEPPPRISRELLTRAIAYRQQEQVFGGLEQSTRRLLEPIGAVEKATRVIVGGVLQAAPQDSQVHGGISSKTVKAGATLFKNAGCANCHGGDQWTSSIRDFTPPPALTDIFCEVNAGAGAPPGCQTAPVTGNPVGAQFLDRFLRDIGSFDLNVSGSGNAIPSWTSSKIAE